MEIRRKASPLFNEGINTPAVAAAVVVKRYTSQASDELSCEVGDMISVIEMPSSEESGWWRGKRGFEVGFFPAECVEIIGSKIPNTLRIFHLKHNSTVVTIHSRRNSLDATTTKPVLRKHGKILTFFRSYLLLRPHHSSSQSIYRDKVFGCDLTEHLVNSCSEIPFVLKCCSEFIEAKGIVDGIYRLSGVTSNIQKLRRSFLDERGFDFNDKAILQDIHCVASLLKMYFRELPNPLLTYELYDQFVRAVEPSNDSEAQSSATSESTKLQKLREIIRKLPPPHYRTLKYLMKHLSRVSAHGSRTGMTPKNIAIVWAPNLLRSKDIETHGGVTALHMIGVQAVLTEYLIRFVDSLFNDESPAVSMRPKSLPLSTPTLLTLEEARSRRGILTDCEHNLNKTDRDVNSEMFHF
ncbi:uncharacterized protein B4U79_06479 [Dinothrombium tinctorium]|uniref:Uncharacterized protein n=1 Tax=Dinothrombium tinctorium TaxID=1965070 RepID=A0A443RAY5_9ACAR|nr:uncharacterized protein B4U79_06479 [Dinothrombium tinctorium]